MFNELQKKNPTSKNVFEAIILTREKISNKENWTQKVFCRNNLGYEVGLPVRNVQCAWCLAGALSIVCDDIRGETKLYLAASKEIMKEINIIYPLDQYMTHFNDTSSHEKIIELLDNVISKLKNKE